MSRLMLPVTLGLAMALSMAQAGAQSPVTLGQAVEAAWQRTAQSAEVAGQVRRAEAARLPAAAWWAAPPSVELGTARDRQRAASTSRETELGLSVPLWLPGQRAARLSHSEAELAAAASQAAAARLRVAGLVREAAAEVALQKAELLAAQVQSRALLTLAQDVERRVAAGDLARTDALAAQAERLAADSALAQVTQRLQAAELQWQALTGLQAVAELAEAPVDSLKQAPGSAHPALRAALSRVEVAQQRLKIVDASRRDAPQLALRGRREVATGEPHTTGVGVAVRIPLGTADRNQPLLAAALSELTLAEATQRELAQQLDARLAAARLAQDSARQQWAQESARGQLLQERAALLEKSFKAGETALPEMLRALTAATQAQASVARAQAALALSTSRLQQALGVMP